MTFDPSPPTPPTSGIKIPETCVARVREELLLMDEEVKKRRKEKQQQERMRQMEQENKRLPENQNPVLNHFLVQNPSHVFKQNPNQSALQRTPNGSLSQLEAQIQSALQQPPYSLSLFPLQRNQTRTHNGWPNSSPSSSSNNQVALPKTVSHRFSQFYNQPFLPSYHLSKSTSLQLHQAAPSPDLSSSNPLNEILDLTMSSPSPSTDSTDAGPSLDTLPDFNLALFPVTDAQHPAQTPQPLMLQQHHHPAPQQPLQQNHNLLATNHDQDLLEILGLALSPQMPPQKANPSSSTSSCSSSTTAASSLPNNPVALFSIPSSSPSSSSSSSSLFSNSFPAPYLLPQSDSVSLTNGHCSSGALDVREALNSMLQAGRDRKSVIHYPQQD